MEVGIQLMEYFLQDVQVDVDIWDVVVVDILIKCVNQKQSKDIILWLVLLNYVKFGFEFLFINWMLEVVLK